MFLTIFSVSLLVSLELEEQTNSFPLPSSLHQKLHLGIVKYSSPLGERRWALLAVHMVCFMLECAFGPLYVISGASLIAQMVKNPLAMQETCTGSLGQENLLEKGMVQSWAQTTAWSCLLRGWFPCAGTVLGSPKAQGKAPNHMHLWTEHSSYYNGPSPSGNNPLEKGFLLLRPDLLFI